MVARVHDSGTPQPAVRLPNGTWAMDSFRGAAASYVVNLERGTCSCPHFCRRLAGTGEECKHLTAARRQADWLARVETARALSDADLTRLLAKYAADPVIGGALRVVREERRQAAGRDAALRTLFA